MNISKNLSYFFYLPLILSVLAVMALLLWGLKPGIDLTGGSLLQISYTGQVPPVSQMQAVAAPLNLGELRVQPAGANTYIVRTRALSNDEKNNLEAVLGGLG